MENVVENEEKWKREEELKYLGAKSTESTEDLFLSLLGKFFGSTKLSISTRKKAKSMPGKKILKSDFVPPPQKKYSCYAPAQLYAFSC